MELRDYTPEEIDALIDMVEEGAMRRDMGIDSSIPQYDVPRETPSLRSSNTMLGDFAGRQLGPLAGELVSGGERVIRSTPEFAYHASGLGMVEDGAKNVSEGMNKGSVSRVAGGLGEIGLAAMPLSGKALSVAYRTVPRAMGTGAAYGVSPLVAAGVFSPEDAQAADDQPLGVFKDNASKYGPGVLMSTLMGAIPGVAYKTVMKKGALDAQQEVADLGQVMANREMADAAKRAKPDVGFHSMVDADVRALEPPIYHNQGKEYLENFTMGNAAQKASDIEYIDRDGAIVGGLAAMGADQLLNMGNDEHSLGQSVAAGVLGGGISRMTPALVKGKRTPFLRSNVEQYNPQDTLNRTRPLVQPIANAHPIEVRETVLRKIKEGEAVKTLARDYGVSETAIRRWKKLDSSKTPGKPSK